MSKLKALDAGRFNRQLTIENQVEVSDGLGGYTKTYEANDAVWAHVCPIGSVIKSEADNQFSEITHKILMRFRAGITTTTRFITGTRRFDVETVRDPDESRRYLECLVVERS